MMFRCPKTDQNTDDLKVLRFGVGVALAIMVSSLVLPRFPEYRWYRDITLLTPFHSVVLSSVYIENSSIVITGHMIKRRCVYKSLTGYVVSKDGHRFRVPVDTSPENTSKIETNRPPSLKSESWGPWKVTNTITDIIPIAVEIYAQHVKCPTEPVVQSNLFLRTSCKDFIR